MVVTILIWIIMVVGTLFLLLLVVPFRISLSGQADDRKGLSYEMVMDWAFGFITIIAVHGEPVMVFLLGFRIWSLPIKSWERKKAEKKSKKKRFSARALFQWIKEHFKQIAMIQKRFARAVFIKGYIEGSIGLPDPADTARIGLLCQHIKISKGRFKMALNCVYDHEMVKIKARVQATPIIGYLGLVALKLILEKETRVMLRGLAHA